MRLVSFTVEKYRSIETARKIATGDTTILIGPNNEGKSNILRALVTAMHVLTRGIRFRLPRGISSRFYYERQMYNWERDFPLHLQEKQPNGRSVVILEFGLTVEEVQQFRSDIGSDLNGTLPLRMEIGREEAEVKVAKQGRGGKTLTAKSGRVGKFVADRLSFEHIEAVRTARSAQRVVDQLVERELRTLEDDPDYETALQRIAELQAPILEQLSSSMKTTLVTFLPAIQDVRIEISPEGRYQALRRSCEVVVDDGAATRLEYKGDGVQSLAAIGIMRHASEKSTSPLNIVIAVEEPESHLHPEAIHELREVLAQLAKKHQVVLTTHCPLFVNRANLASNVIVKDNKARAASSIKEVRDVLGVRAADNLQNANLILLVEGEEDKTALSSLLAFESHHLRVALEHGTLALDSLLGGSNLAYKTTQHMNTLCSVHAFLDDDDAGRRAFEKALADGLLSHAEVNFATCDGKAEAELEDLYDAAVYQSMIDKAYGVELGSVPFRSSGKWSDRMRDSFRKQGKLWNDRVKNDLKRKIALLVADDPGNALQKRNRGSLDALIRALEKRLAEPA